MVSENGWKEQRWRILRFSSSPKRALSCLFLVPRFNILERRPQDPYNRGLVWTRIEENVMPLRPLEPESFSWGNFITNVFSLLQAKHEFVSDCYQYPNEFHTTRIHLLRGKRFRSFIKISSFSYGFGLIKPTKISRTTPCSYSLFHPRCRANLSNDSGQTTILQHFYVHFLPRYGCN